MVIISLFAAIITIISMIPTGIYLFGVPATFQTFIVVLVGFVLGSNNATKATGVYILLGVIGIPVFSGFRGGIGAVMSVTGGYIIGFMPLAFFAGKWTKDKIKGILGAFIGLVICHTIGVLWFACIAKVNALPAILTVSLPYLPKDILSVIAAYFGAKPVRKAMNKIN